MNFQRDWCTQALCGTREVNEKCILRAGSECLTSMSWYAHVIGTWIADYTYLECQLNHNVGAARWTRWRGHGLRKQNWVGEIISSPQRQLLTKHFSGDVDLAHTLWIVWRGAGGGGGFCMFCHNNEAVIFPSRYWFFFFFQLVALARCLWWCFQCPTCRHGVACQPPASRHVVTHCGTLQQWCCHH